MPSSPSSVGLPAPVSPSSLPSPLPTLGASPRSVPTSVPPLCASPRSVPTSVPTLGASPRSMPGGTSPRIHRKHVRFRRLRERPKNDVTEQRKRHVLFRLPQSMSPPSALPSAVPSPVPSPVPSLVSTNAGQPSPEPTTVPTHDDSPSHVPNETSCHSASDNSSNESSRSTFLSSSNQHNGPCKRVAVHKLKKVRRLQRSRRPKTKLLYNHYVGPGDGWTFLGLSDLSDNSLDVPLPSPSSIPIHHLQVLLVMMC